MNEEWISLVTETVLEVLNQFTLDQEKVGIKDRVVPVGISARHIHLCRADIEILFGSGYSLTPLKPLSQPGQFACEEILTIIGPKGRVEKVRILGPERVESQVEISTSDSRKLGIVAPIRGSGDIKNTPGIILENEGKQVSLNRGVIIAERHLHISPKEAIAFGVSDGEIVGAVVRGEKGGILGNIRVRVSPSYHLDLHLDTDDANAFSLTQGQFLKLVKEDLSEDNL